VGPGKSAITRSDVNGLSEVTKDFLNIMRKAEYTFPSCVENWIKFHKTVEVINKMQFDFSFKIGTLLQQKNLVPIKPIEDWDSYTVAEWMSHLRLSAEFNAQDIVNQNLDGAALMVIFDDNSWKQFGFKFETDVIKIKAGIKKFINKNG